MAMPKLTKEETEVMKWAGKSFEKPWFDLCDVFKKIHDGEKLSNKEARVDPFFVPFKINGKMIYWIMKSGITNVMLGKNASLFTIILNKSESKIIWSCIERENDGVYVECHELKDRLGKEWDKKTVEMLKENDLKGAYNYLKEWVATQKDIAHIEPGVMKVANIMFFKAFQDAYEESSNGKNLTLFGVKATEAVERILDEGWIRFYPQVNFERLLRVIKPLLSFGSPLNKLLQKVLKG